MCASAALGIVRYRVGVNLWVFTASVLLFDHVRKSKTQEQLVSSIQPCSPSFSACFVSCPGIIARQRLGDVGNGSSVAAYGPKEVFKPSPPCCGAAASRLGSGTRLLALVLLTLFEAGASVDSRATSG